MVNPPQCIAILVDHLYGGGSERVVSHIANEWADSGRKVHLITMSPENNKDYYLSPKVMRHSLNLSGRKSGPFSGIQANWQRIQQIRQLLKHTQAQVFISFILPMNILAILASIGVKCPVVISERSDPKIHWFGVPWHVLRFLLYRFADRVTANSQGVVDAMHIYAPKHKLAFVPNPLKIPADISTQRSNENVFLAVGRLAPQKAYDILLQALYDANKQLGDWKLEVLGVGPLQDELIAQAESLGIDAHITWHGQVADPFPFYRRAKLFLMPSRFEGTPNAMLEAMSCGLTPIVSDASPGLLEIVKHKTSGWVVPVEDIKILSASIIQLSQDENLRQTLAEGAIQSVAHLRVDRAMAEWDRVISI